MIERNLQNRATVESPDIGVEEYVVQNCVNQSQLELLNSIRNNLDKDLAGFLSFRLHKNSSVASNKIFGSDRPASAYYSIYGNRLTIVWGKMDMLGLAKLHDFLRDDPVFLRMRENGCKVRSGHTATITIPSIGQPVRVALFDSLSDGKSINSGSEEFPMITTMIANGIVPITSDGYIVKFAL